MRKARHVRCLRRHEKLLERQSRNFHRLSSTRHRSLSELPGRRHPAQVMLRNREHRKAQAARNDLRRGQRDRNRRMATSEGRRHPTYLILLLLAHHTTRLRQPDRSCRQYRSIPDQLASEKQYYRHRRPKRQFQCCHARLIWETPASVCHRAQHFRSICVG